MGRYLSTKTVSEESDRAKSSLVHQNGLCGLVFSPEASQSPVCSLGSQTSLHMTDHRPETSRELRPTPLTAIVFNRWTMNASANWCREPPVYRSQVTGHRSPLTGHHPATGYHSTGPSHGAKFQLASLRRSSQLVPALFPPSIFPSLLLWQSAVVALHFGIALPRLRLRLSRLRLRLWRL